MAKKRSDLHDTNLHVLQISERVFKENNIAYTEHNVATDMERRNEMIERSGQMGVPSFCR